MIILKKDLHRLLVLENLLISNAPIFRFKLSSIQIASDLDQASQKNLVLKFFNVDSVAREDLPQLRAIYVEGSTQSGALEGDQDAGDKVEVVPFRVKRGLKYNSMKAKQQVVKQESEWQTVKQ